MSEPKYRLSLTATNIRTIMAMSLTEENVTKPDVQDVIAALAPTNRKIQEGTKQPDYIPKPRPTLEELLGIEPDDIPTVKQHHTAEDMDSTKAMTFGTNRTFSSKEEYWEWSYKKWAKKPEACTTGMVEAAMEYMYLKGMLSEADSATFELGKPIPNLTAYRFTGD